MLNEFKAAAEQFLDQMIEADRNRDFALFMKNFDSEEYKTCKEYTKGNYLKDIDEHESDLGNYCSREYLGCVKGRFPDSYRFVWKGICEKNDVVIIVGVVKKNSRFFVTENMYH